MSSVDHLKEFFREQLAENHRSIDRFDEETIDHRPGLSEISWSPDLLRSSADVPQHRVFKNEEVLTEVEPELPQMKEEPENLNVTEEEEGSPRQDEEQPGTGSEVQGHELLKNWSSSVDHLYLQHPDLFLNIICKDEDFLADQWFCKQENTSSLDQEEPDPPQIKEEQEDLCISQDEEQLESKQKTRTFMETLTDEERDHGEPELTQKAEKKLGRDAESSPSSESQRNTNTGQKALQCEFCGKVYKSRSKLKAHYRVHTGERPYVCKTCGKSFSSSSSLHNHVNIHSDERPHSCEQCGRSFRVHEKLLIHIRTHTGERPYSCKTCGKRFSQNGNLTVHMRIHTGEKRYPCDKCEKRFSNSGDLSRHMSTHTGKRPYSCPTCERSFTQNGSLTAHMRTHTGERPFLCETCGKCFRQNRDLLAHKTTRHI